MKVVHWNTHHGGLRTDGKLDVHGITTRLVAWQPDLVSLNEIEEHDGYGNTDQMETHRAALEAAQGVKWYATFASLLSASDKLAGDGVVLLSKTPFTQVTRKNLGGRPALLGLIGDLLFVTTHADPKSPQLRNVELAQLLLTLAKFSAPKLLVCGDFNATPTAVEIAPWPVLYKDAWTEAKKAGTATSFIVNGVTHGVHRIDYQFTRGLTVQAVDVPDTSVGGVFPSDHHPVIATYA